MLQQPLTSPSSGDPVMLSAAAVARRCGVSLRHVRRLIAGHALPVHRIGRTVWAAEADLRRFLAICQDQAPVSNKP